MFENEVGLAVAREKGVRKWWGSGEENSIMKNATLSVFPKNIIMSSNETECPGQIVKC